MYTPKYMRWRKLIARTLVAMLTDSNDPHRNKQWIYDHYGVYLLGVDYDTFLNYLDDEEDPLRDLELPSYILIGLWLLVNLPMGFTQIPKKLAQKLMRKEWQKKVDG